MKFQIRILSLFMILLLLLSFEVSAKKDDKKKDKKKQTLDLPEWFINPPNSKDAIYASGYAKSANMNLALASASDWARQEISRIIGVKIATMTKQFLEQAGVDNATQITEFTSIISKSISTNLISGSKIEQREIRQDGDIFICFVLIKVTLVDMTGAISEAIKNNNAEYAKLKANKASDDLAKELEKIETKDIDKPSQPKVE